MKPLCEASLARVLAAVPSGGAGEPPRAIHARVATLARLSVCHALAELTRRGAVVAEGEICRRRYRRAA